MDFNATFTTFSAGFLGPVPLGHGPTFGFQMSRNGFFPYFGWAAGTAGASGSVSFARNQQPTPGLNTGVSWLIGTGVVGVTGQHGMAPTGSRFTESLR